MSSFLRPEFSTFQYSKDLTERFSGWQNWFELTQGGVQKLVSVAPGPRAKEVGEVVTDHAEFHGVECLEFVAEKYRVEKIIQNEPVEHPIDSIRLVSGLHLSEAGPLTRVVAEAKGEGIETSYRKFRALLKYDVFTEEWKVGAFDIAEREGDFQTKQVLEGLE